MKPFNLENSNPFEPPKSDSDQTRADHMHRPRYEGGLFLLFTFIQLLVSNLLGSPDGGAWVDRVSAAIFLVNTSLFIVEFVFRVTKFGSGVCIFFSLLATVFAICLS